MILIVELEKHLFADHSKGNLSCMVSCPRSFVTTFSDSEDGEGESSHLGGVLAGEVLAVSAAQVLGLEANDGTLHSHLGDRYP